MKYHIYTAARVFVLLLAFHVRFQRGVRALSLNLRMKSKSTYLETHEYSLTAL